MSGYLYALTIQTSDEHEMLPLSMGNVGLSIHS